MVNKMNKIRLLGAGDGTKKTFFIGGIVILLLGVMFFPAVNALSFQRDLLEKPLESTEISNNENEGENEPCYRGNSASIVITDPEVGYIYIFKTKSIDKIYDLEMLKLSFIIGKEMFVRTSFSGDIVRAHFKIKGFVLGDVFECHDMDPSDGFSADFPDAYGLRLYSIYVDAYNADDEIVAHDEMVWSTEGGAFYLRL